MPRPKPTVLWLLFFAISLTACQSAPVQTRVLMLPPPGIPAALLLPTDGPTRPPRGATQRDAALVIAQFIVALASCNTDKSAVARIIEENEDGVAGQRR